MATKDDLSEFRKATGRAKRPCPSGLARKAMTPTQRRNFDRAMKDRSISDRAIKTVIETWGFNVSWSNVYDHRRDICGCPR